MKMNPTMLLSCLLTSLIGMAANASEAEQPPVRVGEAYPLTVCPVTGNPLGEKPVVVILKDMPKEALNGREVRFCCGGCKAKFDKDPVAANDKLDEMIVASQLPVYPSGTCIVMEDEVMSDPQGPDARRDKNVVIGNRLYRVCCKSCIRRIKKNPEKYQKVLDDRIKKQQAASYPLEICVVTGRPYGDTPFELVVANRLVRTCCGGCATKVKASPAMAVSQLNAAHAASKADSTKETSPS